MTRWPLVNRNKVIDSKVHVPVESCTTLENETVKTLSQKVSRCTTLFHSSFSYIHQLLDHWNTLPVYNRIPKRQIEVCTHFNTWCNLDKISVET